MCLNSVRGIAKVSNGDVGVITGPIKMGFPCVPRQKLSRYSSDQGIKRSGVPNLLSPYLVPTYVLLSRGNKGFITLKS